jgi:hypothetical protein
MHFEEWLRVVDHIISSLHGIGKKEAVRIMSGSLAEI